MLFLAQLTSFKHLPDSREEVEPQLENSCDETKVTSHEPTYVGSLEPVDLKDSSEPVDSRDSSEPVDSRDSLEPVDDESSEYSSDESDETTETEDEFDLDFK